MFTVGLQNTSVKFRFEIQSICRENSKRISVWSFFCRTR